MSKTMDTVSPKEVRIGRVYEHPEHRPIRVTDGAYLVGDRVSNLWHWVVLETGEQGSGYCGGDWGDIDDDYVTVSIPKAQLGISAEQAVA